MLQNVIAIVTDIMCPGNRPVAAWLYDPAEASVTECATGRKNEGTITSF